MRKDLADIFNEAQNAVVDGLQAILDDAKEAVLPEDGSEAEQYAYDEVGDPETEDEDEPTTYTMQEAFDLVKAAWIAGAEKMKEALDETIAEDNWEVAV